MKSIELMKDEHRMIKRMLTVMKQAALRLYTEKTVSTDDFKEMIDFVRQFADAHHHGKEEDYFFNEMVAELGAPAEKLVTHGMLVEHDLGRLYMSTLEAALSQYDSGQEAAAIDIIGNVVAYTDLLTRHIEKEDDVVFSFADRGFKEETRSRIESAFETYEAAHAEARERYTALLEKLETRYL